MIIIKEYKSCPKTGSIHTFINRIVIKELYPKKILNKPLSAPFREAINRFYGLIDLYTTNQNANSIVKKFGKVLAQYQFMASNDCKSTLQYLNWYRDRILHNGNKLPSLWLFDYIISQLVIPIVDKIIIVDKEKYQIDFFYLKTVTGIDILKHFSEIRFEFKDLKSKRKQADISKALLMIGHLKELGRANLNMNLFVRENRPTYEYNYTDPKGRGERFASAEKVYPQFKKISVCPCCGVNSLVLYRLQIKDLWSEGKMLDIDWVKCYTCEYHLRYDTLEPAFLYLQQLFNQ